MNVIIKLSQAEVKGIKAYLREVSDIEKPTINDIRQEIRGIVDSSLHCPRCAVSDKIKFFEDNE